MGATQAIPVQVGPPFWLAEVGRLGHGLGAELGDESHLAGKEAGEPGEVAFVAVVPAEIQVAVGAVEHRWVGEDAGVGDHGPGPVGFLDGVS